MFIRSISGAAGGVECRMLRVLKFVTKHASPGVPTNVLGDEHQKSHFVHFYAPYSFTDTACIHLEGVPIEFA
jgi:hypothetical protein